MIGSGRTSMATSVRMLGNVDQMKNSFLLMHLASSIVRSQFAENGLHAANVTMVELKLEVIKIAASMYIMSRVLRMGNNRWYRARMASLGMLTINGYSVEMATRYFLQMRITSGLLSSQYSM